MTSSAELRSQFLEFFRGHGHEVVPSSSLIPVDDPTLLFTNAGMVQFKDVFLGVEKRPYVRAVSSQRCVRAGGKHNDLENVGYTARHHTFFEMLGNFSFGDYFKREAITYAWQFLTDVLKLPREKLWVTVYETDDEAYRIWTQEIGIPLDRITRIGDKPGGGSDNFWQMGDTGPCGPCTEVFYDHGPHIAGGPPGSPDEDGDRYIEIWNLVFMQYNRAADGTLSPLPKPSVDTGMGLERLAAVMQGVHSNYDIDLFRNLIRAAADLAGVRDTNNNSLRVIADHIRSCAFLITDGVTPSNEGRGYVLRRIIRRAVRHGHGLGLKEPFFYKLVAPLVKEMGAAYPELVRAQAQVERALQREEERFRETLDDGMKILQHEMASLRTKVIPGETAFRLYDTYGFPVDLTADFAKSHGLEVDMAGFEQAMEAQRERARAASQFGADYSTSTAVKGHTQFTGYDGIREQAQVTGLYRNGEPVNDLTAGAEGMVVLDRTPFYAESGGQAGDRGVLQGTQCEFEVRDTQKVGEGAHGHVGVLTRGSLRVGDTLSAEVDEAARRATALNHSATHLLHAALRKVLGDHVAQKGSLVNAERLRFDFAHFAPLSRDELVQIERLVNEQIRANAPVETRLMAFDEARASGAMALFGEKYGDEVRVLRIGDFSTELCGGTHAGRAGDIGLFKILYETGIASGVRRVEALTGATAVAAVEAAEEVLGRVASLVKGGRDEVEDKVQQLIERGRKLEKELDQLKGKLASSQGSDLASQATEVAGVKVLAARLDGADSKALRDTVDQLKNKLGSAVVVLAAVSGDKVNLVAGVTADAMHKVKAGELVNSVAQQVGGKGGGRADMAQAGGTDPRGLDAALAGVPAWVGQRLA